MGMPDGNGRRQRGEREARRARSDRSRLSTDRRRPGASPRRRRRQVRRGPRPRRCRIRDARPNHCGPKAPDEWRDAWIASRRGAVRLEHDLQHRTPQQPMRAREHLRARRRIAPSSATLQVAQALDVGQLERRRRGARRHGPIRSFLSRRLLRTSSRSNGSRTPTRLGTGTTAPGRRSDHSSWSTRRRGIDARRQRDARPRRGLRPAQLVARSIPRGEVGRIPDPTPRNALFLGRRRHGASITTCRSSDSRMRSEAAEGCGSTARKRDDETRPEAARREWAPVCFEKVMAGFAPEGGAEHSMKGSIELTARDPSITGLIPREASGCPGPLP